MPGGVVDPKDVPYHLPDCHLKIQTLSVCEENDIFMLQAAA